MPDGKRPFVDFFTDDYKSNPHSKGCVVRSAADGDLVYLHVHSTDGPNDCGQALADIFRLTNGKIVERWA